jgi:hypothetical protein
MGQLERLNEEKRARKANGRGSKPKDAAAGNFLVFRPDKSAKESVKADSRSLGEVLVSLSEWVEAGHRLTIGFKHENDAYFVILREGMANYGEAVCLSTWHADPVVAIKLLDYALHNGYGGFPQLQDHQLRFDTNW